MTALRAQFLQNTISENWTEASLSVPVGYTRLLERNGAFVVAGGSQKFAGVGNLKREDCVPVLVFRTFARRYARLRSDSETP